ncbi:type II/IV secretion system protein [Megamonas rupellensis]|uniref:GspE/PulE family protein n=1 Tax=Megamonas rupellensis TaxID=491921 RepID=UPI001956B4E0|nr:GspE/PulE family protein [Megamonas rupellensis]MBM6747740.1 type II/IV secretion system protein [Megamonas rupellensis]
MEIEKDLEQLSLKIMRNLQLQGKHNILQGYRNKSPVADFIDCLLENAYKLQASDIHLEPQEKYLQIRYRIDGKLILIYKASNKISNFLISYLKLISNLDIAEKRLPQDGKFIFSAQNIDIRISTIPVLFGEKVVLRLLGNKENLLNLNQMGFSKMNLKYFKDMISASSGLVVITGPVNSGKSTLLYASLNYLNRLDTNIITIEDPVELNLEGINQMQVNQKAGMDFAVALRASLRQDPDIVMIGEIRDEVVAKQAITTALTGHLVLTTLHTKNALGVPARLIDLGVSPVMLSIALLGMTSQRLVRKICPKCKVSYKPSENSLEALLLGKDFYLGMDLYKGEGCKYCNYTGFLGQIALQEILRPTEKMRYLISRDDVDVNLKREARLTDFKSLLDDGKMKVLQGITTVQEVWKTLNGVYQINEVPRNFTKSDSV